MRTTLDLPDPLLRELKTRAASNGQSLKTLLNELIQRAMRLPDLAPSQGRTAPALPMLERLQASATLGRQGALSNEQLAEQQLDDDMAKLKRIGFTK